VHVSKVGGLRAPRGPRVVFAVALACWAVGVVVYAALPEDSAARYLAANAVYVAGAAFALVCMARAAAGVRGTERLFWGLLATSTPPISSLTCCSSVP
jgi:peptidoglycan/LPS O-acetylase OafA/YrhL